MTLIVCLQLQSRIPLKAVLYRLYCITNAFTADWAKWLKISVSLVKIGSAVWENSVFDGKSL